MKALERLFTTLQMVAAIPAMQAMAQGPATCHPPLLFASDTQEPMRVEEIFLRPDQNRRATHALFRDMLAQQPTDLFLLGDVVNLGYKESRWTFIDSALALAKERGFNVHALLGNHELMGLAMKGERRFQQRFPEHVRTGYEVRRDSIAVILLNSNFSKMSKADVAQQDAWYASALAAADNAPDVRVIIVCCHHSPYSDSKLVGSSPAVQTHFVAPFLKARKSAVFITGHAHLFQHFRVQGKDLFVIGGGGGLHHPLKKHLGAEVCLEPDYDPIFHYLTVQLCGNVLVLVSRRLNDSFSGFDDGCDYRIAVPRTANPR
jgi:predicted nicotinamide N-methyase